MNATLKKWRHFNVYISLHPQTTSFLIYVLVKPELSTLFSNLFFKCLFDIKAKINKGKIFLQHLFECYEISLKNNLGGSVCKIKRDIFSSRHYSICWNTAVIRLRNFTAVFGKRILWSESLTVWMRPLRLYSAQPASIPDGFGAKLKAF